MTAARFVEISNSYGVDTEMRQLLTQELEELVLDALNNEEIKSIATAGEAKGLLAALNPGGLGMLLVQIAAMYYVLGLRDGQKATETSQLFELFNKES